MAESAAASTLQPVVKGVAAIVKHQFNYLCCFTSNINGLEVEAKTLDDATRGVQGEVERERENAQDIVPAVETWLTDSNDFKGKVDGILNEVPNVKSGCLRLTARYSLSKKAMKIAEAIKEHRQKVKEFERISHPKPPAATVPIPSTGTPYEFESRKQIEEKIMTILKGDSRDMIGIYGMGGLGKTFMANKIRNRVLKEHMFDEVVMAVVSQQVDESKIQLQIAEQLGLNLVEQTLLARANRIRERLNDSKRTLLVLDDVWECLKLVELGVPCDSERCKILFTSRNSDVLSRMDVGKVFGMEILSEEEAWLLFKGKAGACVDDMKLNSIAKEVVKECKGLPIALVTIGATMKDEMNERIWKDAKKQLMKANPKNIPDFIKEVYNPIEVSYTKLASEEAKFVFLLCCLFPEDANILVDLLTYFCMGLRIYEDVKSLEEARNMMHALIRMLKNRSLLLDSEDTDNVRMHDVVRDVCIFIAKQKGYIDGNECKWISSFERSDQLPLGLEFPNLRLLFLSEDHFLKDEEEFKINYINTFFKGIRDLYVLSMKKYPWTSLPPTQSLKNLGMLMLNSCKYLETISVVGDLINLEILICQHCDLIEELPVEIRRLSRLKLLDLKGCRNLQSIDRGIISSLIGLEELKMLWSFRKWEAEDKEDRKNAGLRELESLTNLSCLEIEIENPALAIENIRLSSKFERFQIYISRTPYSPYYKNNVLELEWVEGTCLGNWIQMQLLRDTQRLILGGAGVNNVELVKIPDSIYASLFTNLSTINISGCPHLHNLRQLSIAGNDCFPHLEYLIIVNCEVMEQVFLWNEENKNSEVRSHHITKIFPKLKLVKLHDLPNLTSFCQGIEGIDFPLLVEMGIIRCPKMTSMISTTCLNDDHHHSSHIICQQEKMQVSFGNYFKKLIISSGENLLHSLKSSFRGLEELTLIENNLSWFTSLIAESFVSLKVLEIYDCDETVNVIQDDDEEIAVSGGERRTLVFPNLRELDLRNLRKLVTFCESKCDIEFPSLTTVEIRECPNMTNFTLGRLVAPNWKALDTNLNHCLDVSSMKMNKLSIEWPEYPLCHYKISEAFFTRLDELSISHYKGSMSLFSSSIARNLINLRDLFVRYCDEIIQVIKDDEEEEKVVSGGEKTSLFPKLERLSLYHLRKLVTFCEWNCDVELPSLKKVVIENCPNMTKFTLGSLTTPILADFIIDYEDVGATKDLNGLLQQRFDRAKEAKEKKENEKEVEEEEEKQSNVFKDEKKEEKEKESEKEEEKQSYVINNKELKSEQEEKHMKGEIEEQQK